MNNDSDSNAQPPWYRQVWPWMLIAIPFSSVLGGILMIYLATSNPDHLVKDSYYKDGMAINRQMDRDQRAAELNLEAKISFRASKGEIQVSLQGSPESALVVELMHPVNSDLDLKTTLYKDSLPENFRGSFATTLNGRWYIEVRDPENEWRMRGRIFLPAEEPITMKPTIK